MKFINKVKNGGIWSIASATTFLLIVAVAWALASITESSTQIAKDDIVERVDIETYYLLLEEGVVKDTQVHKGYIGDELYYFKLDDNELSSIEISRSNDVDMEQINSEYKDVINMMKAHTKVRRNSFNKSVFLLLILIVLALVFAESISEVF